MIQYIVDAFTVRFFIKLKHKIQKLEQKVEILRKAGCTTSAPLQERLQELAKRMANIVFMHSARHSVFPVVPSITKSG